MDPFQRMFVLSLALFFLGMLGVLWRRNLLVGLMSLQLMLASGQLAFVAFGRGWAAVASGALRTSADGQSFALVSAITMASQIVVGLAIVVAFVRNSGSVDVEDASKMRW